MPWVRARLRDQVVFARATPDGALQESGGVVEIRYKPNDGRLYKARAQNLTIADPTLLPDDTCGDAQAVTKAAASGEAAAPSAPAPRNASSARSSAAEVIPAVPDGSIIAYTDGACSGNPGPAGLGMVVLDGRDRTELSEFLGTATNNIAELTAVLRALEHVADPARPIVVHTDSKYAIGVLTQGWKAKANQELITKIRAELARHKQVRLQYVPGHAGVSLNERADQLAREAIAVRKTSKRDYPGYTPPAS